MKMLFESLPKEVLVYKILQWLDVESLVNLSKVSKMLREVCYDGALWTQFDASIVQRNIKLLNSFQEATKHDPRWRYVTKLIAGFPNSFYLISSIFPNTRNLKLTPLWSAHEVIIDSSFLLQFPRLESIESELFFSMKDVTATFGQLSLLTRVTITVHHEEIKLLEEENFIKFASRIKYLHLSTHSTKVIDFLAKKSEYFTTLEELSVPVNYGQIPKKLLSFLRQPSLKVLHLRGQLNLDEECVTMINNSKLREFSSYWNEFSGAFFMGSSLKSLTLSLHNRRQHVSNPSLYVECPNLETLDIDGTPFIQLFLDAPKLVNVHLHIDWLQLSNILPKFDSNIMRTLSLKLSDQQQREANELSSALTLLSNLTSLSILAPKIVLGDVQLPQTALKSVQITACRINNLQILSTQICDVAVDITTPSAPLLLELKSPQYLEKLRVSGSILNASKFLDMLKNTMQLRCCTLIRTELPYLVILSEKLERLELGDEKSLCHVIANSPNLSQLHLHDLNWNNIKNNFSVPFELLKGIIIVNSEFEDSHFADLGKRCRNLEKFELEGITGLYKPCFEFRALKLFKSLNVEMEEISLELPNLTCLDVAGTEVIKATFINVPASSFSNKEKNQYLIFSCQNFEYITREIDFTLDNWKSLLSLTIASQDLQHLHIVGSPFISQLSLNTPKLETLVITNPIDGQPLAKEDIQFVSPIAPKITFLI